MKNVWTWQILFKTDTNESANLSENLCVVFMYSFCCLAECFACGGDFINQCMLNFTEVNIHFVNICLMLITWLRIWISKTHKRNNAVTNSTSFIFSLHIFVFSFSVFILVTRAMENCMHAKEERELKEKLKQRI